MEPATNHESQLVSWLQEYRGILERVARSFAGESVDQKDLVQEMAVQLWQSLPRFSRQSKASTWIYRVCLNTALRWRRDVRGRQAVEPLEDATELASGGPEQQRLHENEELLATVYGQIRALPPAERSLVILHLDGLSYREISEILGMSENHVGVALTRARKKLAESLKEVRDEL